MEWVLVRNQMGVCRIPIGMPHTNVAKDRINEVSLQLLKAGAVGGLKGTLVGLVSGYYFSYRHNHGVNTRFFLRPSRIAYLVSWAIVGITFSMENAKMAIARNLAEEEDLRRIRFYHDELEHPR